MPISAMMSEPYIQNETEIKPLKAKLDLSKTPVIKRTGVNEAKDFVRYTRINVLTNQSASRIPIRKLDPIERTGAKYGVM